MRILIVNAHTDSPVNQKAFQDLLACIKEIVKTHNGLLEIKDEYIIRTRDNLEDFLYDDHTAFSQPGPGKHFDTLDFVIVSGDLHSLPWHPSNIKVLTLLRMCLKVKKCLFAIGFAMQALVYLSASNLDYHVNIINGDGKGGKLGDLGKLQIPPDKIGNQDLFLDNVTGDLYHFQYETNEWAPLCNIGLHHSRTAQEFNTIGKFVIKTPIYRPKKSINNIVNTTLLDENVEKKCYIKKVYLKHWLFQNCDMDFVVPCKGRWETHAFNFTNKDKTFEVLAESEHGAFIIEYPRIIGVKFLVTKRYKETYHLLSNFIVKYADEIICKGKNQNMSILTHVPNQPSASYRFQTKTSPDLEIGGHTSQRLGHKQLQGFKHRRLTEMSPTPEHNQPTVFKHSGYASKMKGKVILQTNFISSLKVRYDSQSPSPLPKEGKFLTNETLMGKYSLHPKKFQTEDDLSFLEANKNSFSRNDDRSILKSANNMSYRQNKKSNIKGVSMFDSPKGILKNSIDDDSSLTKEDVRRWLYPEINESTPVFDRKVWVPGNLSQNKSENCHGSKPIRLNTCSPDYRKRGPVPTLTYGSIDVPQKSLRAADPYKTSADIMKEHQKREDEKILGTKKFVLSKGPVALSSSIASPSSRFASVSTSKYKEY